VRDHPFQSDGSSASSAVLLRIDQCCDRFEAAWKKGGAWPQIADYLVDAPMAADGAARRGLLIELVMLDLEYRWRRSRQDAAAGGLAAGKGGGDLSGPAQLPRRPCLDDYVSAFPELGPLDRLPAKLLDQERRVRREWEEQQKALLTSTEGPDGNAQRVGVDATPKAIGRYQVEDVLGRGAFGTVYQAYDVQLQRRVAVKVPRADLVADRRRQESFLVEGRILASLDHEGIVPVYDAGQTDDGVCYVVSKLIDGRTLAAVITQGRLGCREAVEIVTRVADALHYAHRRRLVHRDVKPGNILIDTAGNPHLVDFGLALKDTDPGKQKVLLGTPAYMSPEQARGDAHLVDGRSDIFSLGVVFYELLTGMRPFLAEDREELLRLVQTHEPRPPRQIDDAIPKELERICQKAMSKRVTNRYSTASDMAEELRQWAAAQEASSSQSVLPGKRAATPSVAAPIVPRGLRPFTEKDADFFFQLLPGPYDRYGLPEPICFWKSAIEECDADRTFRVGVIYGPTGCGKSSLVRAGLLPILAEQVTPIYVEASPGETERRLLNRLRKRFPSLRSSDSLIECLRDLRQDPGGPKAKVLLVIDQFEQWLHAHSSETEPELLAALRQCDGEHLQSLILVRDDFWMAATRFMHQLEIPLVEGENSTAVDLFELDHARHVLIEFGRAYQRLPNNLEQLTPEQARFLDAAIAGLAESGRVISVRLTLFAEMLKHREWTAATLRQIGGAQGIGLAFFEEVFDSAHAPPEHRFHQKAIRSVLQRLLPEPGSTLKGAMRSRRELLDATGYAQGSGDFETLLRVLGDLRLITPTDPEGSSVDESDPHKNGLPGTREYYQLTHDYLVSPLREWLGRKRRETRRGRAEILLEERVQQWNASRQSRFLPSLWEALQILAWVPRRKRTELQREMLNHALVVHGGRLIVGLMLAAMLALPLALLIPRAPSQFDLLQIMADSTAPITSRHSAIARLRVNDVQVFPRFVDNLREIKEPDLVRFGLGRLAELNVGSSQPAAAGEESSLQRQLVALGLSLVDRRDAAISPTAFQFYAPLARPEEVLEAMRTRVGGLQPATAAAMARHVEALALDSLSVEDRAASLRAMGAILNDGQNSILVNACVAKWSAWRCERLLDELILAYQSTDVKTAAMESVVPYARKLGALQRDALAQEVARRIVKKVPRNFSRIPPSFDLEFCIQAFGQLVALKAKGDDAARDTVLYLLQNRPLLDDAEMLDTLAETVAILDRERRASLTPLREVVDDAHVGLPARVAAVKAIGELGDLQALDSLERLIQERGTLLNLRVAALQSLIKLALGAKGPDEKPTRERVLGIVRAVLKSHNGEAADVVAAAMQGCKELGDASDASTVIPLLVDRACNADAIRCVLSIAIRCPNSAQKLVDTYLSWQTGQGPFPPLPDDPDNAMVGFGLYFEAHPQVTTAAKAMTVALARHQASGKAPESRKHAGDLLARLLQADDAPHIGAAADETTRNRQGEAWRRWWDKAQDKLFFTGGVLRRASQ
jgi:serine/threonine protein kinase